MPQLTETRRAGRIGRVALALLGCVWIVGARPAIASCSGPSGPCSAVVDAVDARFDNHPVPFSAVSPSDSTADTSLAIQRRWAFLIGNHGPGIVGTASINASSSRTFSTTPPPPYTAGPSTLASGDTLRTSTALEDAYAADTAAPGFSSSRAVTPLVMPPGVTMQTLTAKFTVDDASQGYGQMGFVLDAVNPDATWTFTSSSDPVNTTVSSPGPGSQVAVNVTHLVVTSAVVGSFPDSGAFVVGDQSASPGSQVTFSGAQWATQNSLSGGLAPSGFKGFESGPQPSGCGGTWTADAGNSGHPPPAVPALMTVIVSSHISQTGSQLSGDVAHIVVVKTDPSYASDPGHPGTGRVLTMLC